MSGTCAEVPLASALPRSKGQGGLVENVCVFVRAAERERKMGGLAVK